ncbi:MAG: threonylcarbamoyl-AMP synthase [Chitinivibrionales bacterium]|nr:threonylcarbamoyl-AMP synthase [Chitinivibrionales bacterium]
MHTSMRCRRIDLFSIAMIHLEIHPDNPQERFLDQVVGILKNRDGICVYPTDTVYGMGACASNPKAINKIGRLLEKDKKRLFSYICCDFAQIAKYARMSNQHFKLMKRYLPGPFTFILEATNYVPKKVAAKRRTVGIRMPDHQVVLQLVQKLDEALANTSIKLPGSRRGDPDEVRPAVLNEVDVMLDVGSLSDPFGSTIVDLTGEIPHIVRQGKGAWED